MPLICLDGAVRSRRTDARLAAAGQAALIRSTSTPQLCYNPIATAMGRVGQGGRQGDLKRDLTRDQEPYHTILCVFIVQA